MGAVTYRYFVSWVHRIPLLYCAADQEHALGPVGQPFNKLPRGQPYSYQFHFDQYDLDHYCQN